MKTPAERWEETKATHPYRCRTRGGLESADLQKLGFRGFVRFRIGEAVYWGFRRQSDLERLQMSFIETFEA